VPLLPTLRGWMNLIGKIRSRLSFGAPPTLGGWGGVFLVEAQSKEWAARAEALVEARDLDQCVGVPPP
jgi:hypothetical protein